MARLSALAIAIALAVVVQQVAAVPNSYFVTRPTTCVASAKPAAAPMPLEFCHWYNEKSCCTPGSDASALGAFFGLLSVGSGCAPMNQFVRAAYREVREVLCLPCDPAEPKYRVLANVGDLHIGGEVVPDPAAASDAFVWRICSSFMFGGNDLKGGLWGGDGSKFDKCGAQISNDCNSRKQIFYDPVTKTVNTSTVSTQPDGASCGTTYVIPSAEYFDPNEADSTAQLTAGTNFLNALPHWMQGWKYQIVNDTISSFNFNNTPCFGRRGADGYVATASAGGLSVVFVLAALLCAALAM
jgi:hypothetical protein